jgi:plastocyanin
MKRSQSRSLHLAALFTVLGFLLAGAGVGVAQDATPAAETPHPAHIHSGTCTELGDVVYPLTDVAAPDANATPEAMAGHDMGTMDASPEAGDDEMAGKVVTESVTDVDAALDDILADPHAINVHESKENIGNYIACGEITGEVTDGTLEIELGELNDSGYEGEAYLVDNGDDTTTVTVTLMSTDSAASGTPAASGNAAPAGSVQVSIKDFAFNPDPVTIKVGESVTWTNEDSAPHTATAKDREILQSGTLNQGDSYTQTFDTPGTYEYFCEFHSNMKGVIIVE